MSSFAHSQKSCVMSKAAILITGGAGFVGSWIAKAVQEQLPDFQIVVLDRQKGSNGILNLDDDTSTIRFEQLDITDARAVFACFASILNPTAVIHAAGVVPNAGQRYDTSKSAFERCHAVNVVGTQNVLQATRAVGARSFIYTSSVTVLVDDFSVDYPNMTEDMLTGSATLPYGRTKAMAEKAVLEANCHTFRTCALRPSVIFGPGDENCTPTLYSCIAKGETPFIIGDATASLYDFTYVSNVADAHVLALRNLMTTGTAAGKPFFTTNGEPVPFRTFCLAVWAAFGHVPRRQFYIPLVLAWFMGLLAECVTWVTDGVATLSRGSVRELTMTAYCNIERARDVLGYEPRVGLAEGIRLSCEVCAVH